MRSHRRTNSYCRSRARRQIKVALGAILAGSICVGCGQLLWILLNPPDVFDLPSCKDMFLEIVACESNGDCDDGMFCNGLETCVLFECEELSGWGCASGSEPCPEHEVCDEAEDLCRPRTECTTDADCATDEVCFVFACGPGVCSECRATR